jgi:dTDP-4-dehydrorhamnose reductase
MKAIVLGASGLVGSHVLDEGIRRGLTVTGTARSAASGLRGLDVTDTPAVRSLLHELRPDVVVLAAALANVDRCEMEPEASARVNVEAPRAIAVACADMGMRLVHFSTDYIFDGTRGPYGEEDVPRPLGAYGAQKLAAEREIRDILPMSHLILRTTVVYGNESAGKNFLIRLLQNLRNKTPIRVPFDQTGSPTLVNDLAMATWELVDADARGTFNVAGSERMDRHEFARLAATAFGLDPAPIIGVSTRDLEQLAPRPLDAGLRVDKVEGFLGRRMVGASEGLSMLARSLTL